MTGGAQARTATWEDTVVSGPGRDVRVRVFRPRGDTGGWLVWAHGGSWVGGSVEMWHPACADLATRAGATVVSVDYRLAPQHRHPAAVDDVLLALDWAAERSAADGTGGRVAVGGDSAGATLAACAALYRRDQGLPLSAQLLAYPPLDPGCRAPSYRSRPSAFPSRAGLMAAWRELRGPGYGAGTGTYSTPLEAVDLGGLVRAVIAVGELDPVVDDVRAYATALRAAGDEAEMRVFSGMTHGAFLQGAAWSGPGGTDGDALREWLATALRAIWTGAR